MVEGGLVGEGGWSGGSGGTCQEKIPDLVKYPLLLVFPFFRQF